MYLVLQHVLVIIVFYTHVCGDFYSLWNMEWLKLSVWIGTYGFLKEFRPEDPYITQYLTNYRNFTEQEVILIHIIRALISIKIFYF